MQDRVLRRIQIVANGKNHQIRRMGPLQGDCLMYRVKSLQARCIYELQTALKALKAIGMHNFMFGCAMGHSHSTNRLTQEGVDQGRFTR